MARGSAPSSDQLLELLKRAAEELKSVRASADSTAAALGREQAALEEERNAHKAVIQELQTNRQKLEQYSMQAVELRKGASGLETTVARLLETVEKERTRANEAEAALAAAAQDRDASQQKALEALTQERDGLLEKVREVESARSAEGEQHKQDLEAQVQRACEQEASRRADVEQAHAAALSALQEQASASAASFASEQAKHQDTAKKLIEARGKVRELEGSLTSESERLKGLEAAAAAMADQHTQALAEAGEQHEKATATMKAELAEALEKLTRATDNWNQVERQYEVLHREMLEILEQRDDARAKLEAERGERQRLERAFQTRK